jgi:uncharacterized protein (TIGR02118 family)
MTVKLVVLYTQPDDPAAFDEHYFGVHMPLVAKLPNLQRTETGKVAMALDGGELTYYFGSAEGGATAADYGQIAPPGSRMYVQVVDD